MLARILLVLSIPTLAAAADPVQFGGPGHTSLGDWSTAVTVSPAAWRPGETLKVSATLTISDDHLNAITAALKTKPDGLCMLVTAERTFDSDGWIRLSSDEKMSTLVTPTGLAIEGGVQGAITTRFNAYDSKTPVDLFVTRPVTAAPHKNGAARAQFGVSQLLPSDLPPGIYRVRLDFGFYVKTKYYSLNGEAFAYRPFFTNGVTESHIYSPPLRSSGTHVSGRAVDASTIQPRLPWVILRDYNSNGYQGVVADEDKRRFALSDRFLVPDDVILPRYDSTGKTALSYTLEPRFPTDVIELRSNIPWNYARGEMTVKIDNPDGTSTDLGTAPFAGAKGQWPTTARATLTAWKPPAYGYYTVHLAGWTEDIWGNRYEGGGTYHFWIANRMTLATATFQGMPYAVGGRYGRDVAFNPPVPADVQVTATLYVNSDPAKAQTITYSGKASPAGLFTAAQGMQPLTFSAPGEYRGKVLAKYTDSKANLWVCSMTHAGVVYDPNSSIVARGKKLQIGSTYLDRGNTRLEGYTEADGTTHLQHINFPFNSGDVLLIASEGQGSNKIEPILTWDNKAAPLAYDTGMQAIGKSNIKLKTSNGLSPHMFPEYITDWQYFYAGAPRPGMMGRFLVADSGTRAPYWPVSMINFGGQINASSNGDMPGDIYRLIGGVVLRNLGKDPLYAGYLSSAFLLPKGANDNRVIAAGAEDVDGPYNLKSRVFLVGTRPGMTYETGTVFGPAVQIDPVLPANVLFQLDYPDGRHVSTSGTGDATGSWAGDKWTLDIPGLYRYQLSGTWQGHPAVMPGLPPAGGFLYVIEKDVPAGVPALQFDLPVTSTFNPALGLTVSGSSTATKVAYAVIMPGAVLDQGELTVYNGKFQYFFSPKLMNERTPTYDITNRATAAAALSAGVGDVVHLTFFSEEQTAAGKKWHSFARIVLRGTQVILTK